jgi:branched-chain amino acid aminotransferase
MFFIKDGEIHTPTPDCFLNGITRQTVIDLARRRGIKVIERTIMPDELGTFSEVFITGTAAEVTPVREIGPHSYTPGRFCELLLNDYMAEVQPKSRVAAE